MSRLSIDTIYSRQACHAVQTLKIIKKIAKRINCFFFIPIYIYGSSPCASTAFCIYFIIIFFSILPSVFLKAIGQQLPSREQSFLFTFWRMIVIVSLQHSNRLLLRRQIVAVLASSITTASTAALIALFRILFSLAALLIKSFHIVSFISFSETVWLIFKSSRRS